jgi:DNA-binding response OmpR family regulator
MGDREELLLPSLRPHGSESGWIPRVVLAEDDRACRAALHRSLSGAGFRVVSAEDGCVALETIRGWGADVLVTDLMMPRMDGAELLLRVSLAAPWVRCVAMTGAASPEPWLVSARERGAVETLGKPFAPEELQAAIWRALRR